MADYEIDHGDCEFRVDPQIEQIYANSPINLPETCIGCGSEARGGKWFDKTLNYTPRLLFLLIFINFIIYAIIYFFIKKPVDIKYYLCPDCAPKYALKKGICITLWISFIASIFLAAGNENSVFAFILLPLFIIAFISSYFAEHPIKIKKYNKFNQIFFLKGMHSNFFYAIERLKKEHDA